MKPEYYIYGVMGVLILIELLAIYFLLKKKLPKETLDNFGKGMKAIAIFTGKANSDLINGVQFPSNMRMNVTVVTWVMMICMVGIHVYAFASGWDADKTLILLGIDVGLVSAALNFKRLQKKDEDPNAIIAPGG